MARNWWQKLLPRRSRPTRQARQRTAPARRAAFRPALEALEDRTLPSSSPLAVTPPATGGGQTSSSGVQPPPVQPARTVTTWTCPATPSVEGQPVYLSLRVAGAQPGEGTPTGQVVIHDGWMDIGTLTLDRNGRASFSISGLGLGTFQLTASYSGDAHFAASTSPVWLQQVRPNPQHVRIELAASVSRPAFGQAVTFIAEIAPEAKGQPVPTGTVVFRDGSTVLGTAKVDASGKAVFKTSALAVGRHDITASYSGDSHFAAVTSPALYPHVQPAATVTGWASPTKPSVLGQVVTFTAEVVARTPGLPEPTGTVVFRDGSTVLGTVRLDAGGKAVFSTSALGAGGHDITACYSGDAHFAASRSLALSQTVVVPPGT